MRKFACGCLILSALIIGVGCDGGEGPKVRSQLSHRPGLTTGKYFGFRVQQDGQVLDIIDHQVVLQRKPFSLVFVFNEFDGVFANSSLQSGLLDAAAAGRRLDARMPFEGVKEWSSPTLLVDDSEYEYWYYFGNVYKFQQVREIDGAYACKKLVNGFRIDGDRETAVQDFQGDAIYMVFVNAAFTSPNSTRVERQREYLKIIFR